MGSTYRSNNKWLPIFVGGFFVIFSVFMFKLDIETKNRMDSQTYSTNITYETIKKFHKGRRTITHYPIYHYSVNGINYVCKTGTSAKLNSHKHAVSVKYVSNNPRDCYVHETSKDIMLIVFMLVGLFAMCVPFLPKQKKN